MIHWIKQTYKRGGVNIVSWHLKNPVIKGDSWDKTPAVNDVLPGGKAHDTYLEYLDHAAEFFKSVQSRYFF